MAETKQMSKAGEEKESEKSTPEPIFKEILASDQMSPYLAYGRAITQLNMTDPTAVWDTISWNPWMAMSVFRDMELKDAAVSSALDTRRDGVLAKTRRMLPASDKRADKKDAELIGESLEGYFDASAGQYTGLDGVLFEMLDAVGKGVSIGEIVWGDGGDRIYAKKVRFWPQHLFSFGDTGVASYSTASYLIPQTGPLRLRLGMSVPGVGEQGLLPERKFVAATYRPQYSNRWGTAQLLKAFWPSWFKRAGVKQWLRYLEKGSGTVVTRYPDGAGASEKQLALAAARAINEESYSALPNKFIAEVMQHVRQNMGNTYPDFIDQFCNSEIQRVILGQTASSGGNEGWSKGDHQQQVRAEKIEADAKFLMLYVNMCFVWPLTLFNRGPVRKPPMWIIQYEPQRDLSAFSTWLARLWTMRLPISQKFVYNTFQIPEPSEDEKVLELPQDNKEPTIPDTGVDSSADFSEKKTPEFARHLKTQSRSRMERFSKLRPSTTPASRE